MISALDRFVLSLNDLPDQLAHAYAYWLSRKGDALAPSWRAFELSGLPGDLLATTMVVDFGQPLEESRFRYWGSVMTDIHGKDMTGQRPYDLKPPELGAQIKMDHEEILACKKPMASVYGFRTERGFLEAHSLLRMPLSEDGQRIDKVVTCIAHTDEVRKKIAERALTRG